MLSTITSVWTSIATFLTNTFGSVVDLFYAEGQLTLIGNLGVIMAGVSLILLVFNIIRSFLVMRA